VYMWMTGALILIFWGAFQQGASGHVARLVPLAGLAERFSAGSHALWQHALCLWKSSLSAPKNTDTVGWYLATIRATGAVNNKRKEKNEKR